MPPPRDSHSSELIVHRPPQSKALDGSGNWSNYGNFTLKTGSCRFTIGEPPPWAPCQPVFRDNESGSPSPPPEGKVAGVGRGVLNRRHLPPSEQPREGGGEQQDGFARSLISTTLALVPGTCKAQQRMSACFPPRPDSQDKRPSLTKSVDEVMKSLILQDSGVRGKQGCGPWEV